MVTARVVHLAPGPAMPSPGIGRATSSPVAPQRTCQGRTKRK